VQPLAQTVTVTAVEGIVVSTYAWGRAGKIPEVVGVGAITTKGNVVLRDKLPETAVTVTG
jgi:hypothetical protein